MSEFLLVSLTFPTLLYSLVLTFCVIYWLLAATGLFHAHAADGWLDFDTHAHAHAHTHGDTHGDGADAAGLLARLGLAGVPVMLVLTLVSFFGWLTTYFVHLLVLEHLPSMLRWLIGAVVAVQAIVPGLFAASLVLRPIRRFLVRLRPVDAPSLLGRTGVVSTPSVDSAYGMATVDDGGAGLILQVRNTGANAFKRGDRVVLVEWLDAQHAYRVVSEQQFQNP
jgi:hypothetical protein